MTSKQLTTRKTYYRPSYSYTEEIAEEICERVACGESLANICRDEHMPAQSEVWRWCEKDREGFRGRFARAREAQAEHWADQLVDLADSVAGSSDSALVAATKLQIDTRKWVASKLKPKRYGDRVEQIMTVDAGAEPQDAMAVLQAIANDPAQDVNVRLRAAEAALGYQQPKLSSSINRNENVVSIGEELDRARKRIQRGEGPIIDMEPDGKSG